MKKHTLPLLMMGLLTILFVMTETNHLFAQSVEPQTVTLGIWDYSINYAPSNVGKNYSLSQQIYTADEINMEGTIQSIAFYKNTSNSSNTINRKYTVFMLYSDKAAFDSSKSDWIVPTDDDIVFSGDISMSNDAGWQTIELTKTFDYDGVSNLCIIVYDNTGYQFTSNYAISAYTHNSQRQVLHYNSNTYNDNFYTSPYQFTRQGDFEYYKSQIQFSYIPADYPRPRDIQASDITDIDASIGWTAANEQQTGWEVQYKVHDALSWNPVSNPSNPTALTGLLPDTDYDVQVRAIYGEHYSEWNETSFRTQPFAAPHIVQIGGSGSTNYYLPSYGGYKYSLTEQIYTTSEIGDKTGIITSIAFYATNATQTRDYTIYLLPTTLSNLSSGWISVPNDCVPVFEGNVTMTKNQWTIIPFTNPVEYDGENNLCLVVDDNTGSGASPYMKCWAMSTGVSQTRYVNNNSSTNYDPHSPSGGNTNTYKSCIQFAIEQYPAPHDLQVAQTTTSSATLSWVTLNDNVDSWEIQYKQHSSETWSDVAEGSSPYLLEGLSTATDYDVRVRGVYGAHRSDWSTIVFHTDCEEANKRDVVFYLRDTFGRGWEGGAAITVVDVALDEIIATIAHQKDYADTDTLRICEGREIALYWQKGENDYRCSFDVVVCGGMVYSLNESTNPDAGLLTSFEVGCPSCTAPHGLSATATYSNDAPGGSLSWNSGETPAPVYLRYKKCYPMASSWVELTDPITTNTYEFTDLDPYTIYRYQVRTASCADEVWSEPCYFKTSACAEENQVEYTFVLRDSQGDGWNGSRLFVYYDESEAFKLTLENGSSAEQTVYLCDGETYDLQWSSVGQYDYYCSFEIKDCNGTTVFTSPSYLSGNLGSITASCPCLPPTNLHNEVILNAPNIVLRWNEGSAPEYNFKYRESEGTWSDVTHLTTDSIVLSNLTDGTSYECSVQTDCGDKQSEWVSLEFQFQVSYGITVTGEGASYITINQQSATTGSVVVFASVLQLEENGTILGPSSIAITTTDNQPVAYTTESGGDVTYYSFTMPAGAVTITAQTACPHYMLYYIDVLGEFSLVHSENWLSQAATYATVGDIALTPTQHTSVPFATEFIEYQIFILNTSSFAIEDITAGHLIDDGMTLHIAEMPQGIIVVVGHYYVTDVNYQFAINIDPTLEDYITCNDTEGYGAKVTFTTGEGNPFDDGYTLGIINEETEELINITPLFSTNVHEYSFYMPASAVTIAPIEKPSYMVMSIDVEGDLSLLDNDNWLIDEPVETEAQQGDVVVLSHGEYDGFVFENYLILILNMELESVTDITDEVLNEGGLSFTMPALPLPSYDYVVVVVGRFKSSSCTHSFVLEDSWGDGWDGAMLEVKDMETSETIESFTLTSEDPNPNTFELPLDDGQEIALVWHKGQFYEGDNYDYECSFVVYDAVGQAIASGNGLKFEEGQVIDIITIDCDPCVRPQNLQLTNITQNSATLVWDAGDATTWNFMLKDGDEWPDEPTILNTNSITLSNLDPTTQYECRIQTDCGDKQSAWVTYTFSTTHTVTFNKWYTGEYTLLETTTSSVLTNSTVEVPVDYFNFNIVEFEVNDEETDGLIYYENYINDETSFEMPNFDVIVDVYYEIPDYTVVFRCNGVIQGAKLVEENEETSFDEYEPAAADIPEGFQYVGRVGVPYSIQVVYETSDSPYGLCTESYTPDYLWKNVNFLDAVFAQPAENQQFVNYTTSVKTYGDGDYIYEVEGVSYVAGLVTAADDLSLQDQNNSFAIGILTIQDGGVLDMDKSELSNAQGYESQLIIEDGGQLLYSASEDGIYATVKKHISAYENEAVSSGWNFIASPIVLDVDEVQTESNYDLFRFNQGETAKEWENVLSENQFDELAAGSGYLYANAQDLDLELTGLLYSTGEEDENIFPLNYTAGNPFAGWNLIGNPYMCNATLGETPFYVCTGTSILLSESDIIPPCTGVMVQATESDQSVTFEKVVPGEPQMMSPNLVVEVVSATRGASVYDRARVDLGRHRSLEKFFLNRHSGIYIQQDGKDYALVAAEGEGTLSLCFKAVDDGDYTITIDTENVDVEYLHLVDNLTGDDVDLLNCQGYTFTTKTTDAAARFQLVFRTTLH